MNETNPVAIGTAIGVLFTAIATITGHLISSRTAIKTTNIDDREKFTRTLMESLEDSFREHGITRKALAGLQLENISIIRCMVSLEAEHRALYGTLSELDREISKDEKNYKYILSLCRSVIRSIHRCRLIFEEAGTTATSKLMRHNEKENIEDDRTKAQ